MKIFINSRFRNEGSSSNFKIPLLTSITADKLVIGSCIIPYSFDNVITGENNTINFVNTGGVAQSFVIPAGRYTLIGLMDRIRLGMNALDPSPVYIIQQNPNGHVAIINIFPFTITFSSTSAYALLGFTASTAGTSVLSQRLPDVARTRSILIESNIRLARHAYVTDSRGLDSGSRLLEVLPIDFNMNVELDPISILSRESKELEQFDLEADTYTEFNFVLYDDRHRLLDLNGADWSIELVFYRN